MVQRHIVNWRRRKLFSRPSVRRLLSILLITIFISFYIKYIKLDDVIKILATAKYEYFIGGYLLGVLVYLLRVIRWVGLLKHYGVVLSRQNAFLMYLVDVFFNNLISSLSAVVRVLYIGHQIPDTTTRIRLLLLDKMYDFIIPVGIGFVSLLYVLLTWPTISIWFVWMALLLTLPQVIFQVIRRIGQYKQSTWPWYFEQLRMKYFSSLVFQTYSPNRAVLLKVFFLSLISFAVYYICLFSLAFSFSLPVSFTELIMFDAIATIGVFIPLSFAGFGTRDIALAGLLTMNKCPTEIVAVYIFSLVLFRFLISGIGWISIHILNRRGYSLSDTINWQRH